VDCMVCHDSTGTYKKFPTDCGHPAYKEKRFGGQVFPAVDLKNIAQNVKKPSRKNCGACHFSGGGGDGVKHGDLDSSLITAGRELDVHMDVNGLNYRCQRCHSSFNHQISGRKYTLPAPNTHKASMPNDDGNRLSCESCHTDRPHKDNYKLNDHTDKVACQSCHIPSFAREKPTVMYWDWSTSGKMDENGKPFKKKSGKGKAFTIYDSKKGDLKWEKDVIPEYFWFDGSMTYKTYKDKIGDTNPVRLNYPNGSYESSNSRIYPFKIHSGKQPFDKEKKKIIIPKLFGPKESGAYWANWDWLKASENGMAVMGADFSGKIDFIETETYWPITHMVTTKEKSLSCEECHHKKGRLAKLAGFYMPSRDSNTFVDYAGILMVILSFLGVLIHGLIRIAGKKGE
jgi:octaheme c-type cytochrome (tetrathionate reductase family)